jgi:hypothetical protein
MNNTRRIKAFAVMFILALGTAASAYNDVPVPIITPSPAFFPLAQFNAGVKGEVSGGGSYDPDNGSPECCDRGITWHDWFFWPSATGVSCSNSICSAARFLYSSVGKKYAFLQVTDDDYPAATSDSAQCNVWVFNISASLSQSVIGVGDTATLTMNHSPSNLPRYEKLTLNTLAAGVIEVLDGAQTVISGADNSQTWALPGPSTVTVKGCSASPVQAILWLQFTPDGSTFPGSTYNGNSVTAKVVGVQKVVKAGTNDDGPLYVVCADDTIQLQAIPYPSGPFPDSRPSWWWMSEPAGAMGEVTPSIGSDIVTVSGLNVPGEYVIRATSGMTDVGDEITIIIPPPTGPYMPFNWSFNCPPDPGQASSKALADDCGNELSIICEGDAFHFYYKPSGGIRTQVGIFEYKSTNKYLYGKERFIETRHVTRNDHEGIDSDGEGCTGYYCWRVQRHDCVYQRAITDPNGHPWWRRDQNFQGDTETDGEHCPGPDVGVGRHRGYEY